MTSLKQAVIAYVRRHPQSARRFAGSMPRTGLEIATLAVVSFAILTVSITFVPNLFSPASALLLVVATVAGPVAAAFTGLWVRQALSPGLTRRAAGFGCSSASCRCRS